jgi:hypothetical protein
MLSDPDLMLQGFNIHGSFFNTNQQDILTESDAVFNQSVNVNGVGWDLSNPTQINILEDGVYKLFANITTNTAAQFAIAVNGVAVDTTIQGTNKGAGQLTIRTLLELRNGDIVTVKNHTSANSKIVASSNAGGALPSMSLLFTVFKIAPLNKIYLPPCELNSYHSKCFEQFKCFILSNKCLQLRGSESYFSTCSSHHQHLNVGESFDLSTNNIINNVFHLQGTPELIIKKNGIYDIFADVLTNEPAQITMFINGVPDLTTTCGRDSGGNRCIMRQFVKLYKGDIISIRNYQSHSIALTTAINTGGTQIACPVLVMGFILEPLPDCDIHISPPLPSVQPIAP